jgi:hypothetical protein
MRWLLAATLLFLACNEHELRRPARTDTSVTDTSATATSETGTRHQPSREPNVRLESPRLGDVIRTNPIPVRGQARTFENNVVIRVLDSGERLMVETFTTATGEMGTFSPFSKDVFLTRIPGPQITVQAFEYSAKDGSIQHLNSVTVPVELKPRQVILYFPSAKRSPTDCSRVFAAHRTIPSSVSLARLLVEALIAGPTPQEQAEGLDNPFPSGSQVRSVNLRDGVLTVDFNQRLGNVGGSCRVQAIRASLEKTLPQLPGVKRVRITALGDESTALQP